MKNRVTLAGFTALGTVALLAACATGSGGGDDTDVVYDSSAELTGEMRSLGFSSGDDVAEIRLEIAQEALGDAEIALTEGALDIQQFLSAVAAGDPPDIISAGRDQIGSLAARGALLPLTNCIEGEGIDTSQYREPALAQVTFDDEVYGIPEFNQVQITMANSDLLSAAGLTIDDVNGSDWSAVTAANEELTVSDGGKLAVIGFDSKLPEFFPLWVRANGGDILSEDGRTALLDSPEAVEALEFAVGIYEAQGGFSAVKSFRDSADFFGSENQFASNTLGAMPMEQWYINILNDVSADAPMAFDTVRNSDGEPVSFSGGAAWAIPRGSDNPEAACRFAKTMTTVETWVAAGENRKAIRAEEGKPFTGILTGNADADDAVRDLIEPSGDAQWDSAVAAMYEANDYTFVLPPTPADAEFTTTWQDAVNRVLNGQQEPAESLAAAQTQAQEALDEGWAEFESE